MPPKEELASVNPIPEGETLEETVATTVSPVDKADKVDSKEEPTVDAKPDEKVTSAPEKNNELPEPPAKDAPDDDEEEPVPPPRPVSPFTQALATLAEAFPDVEPSVRRAVLVASRGQLDPAFAALLSMSDPNFKPEEIVPVVSDPAELDEKEVALLRRKKKQEQIEADERLARRLASQYSGSSRGGAGGAGGAAPRRSTGRYDDPVSSGPERNFFDDELPEIKKQLQEGFTETKQKVSEWYTNFKKNQQQGGGLLSQFSNLTQQQQDAYGRDSRDEDDGRDYGGRRGPNAYRPKYRQNPNRRYYDQDPNEISTDLQAITLRAEDEDDDEDSLPPPPPPRRPTATSAVTATDAVSSTGGNKPATAPVSALGDSNNSKWEPLKAVSAEGSDDKDAFFIGDSDDEDLEFDDEDDTTKVKKATDTADKSEPAKTTVSEDSKETA